MGQLVMLTQRIGKSANEFLTLEGVNPEAVFLLGKDLNSFREMAEACQRQRRAAPARHARPQTRERLAALMKQYDRRAGAGGRDPGQPARAWSRRATRKASILADSEPLRKGLETLQERLAATGGLTRPARGGDGALGRCCCWPAAPGFLRLYVRRPGARARSSPKASAWRPSARSRKPSASTTPTRRPFCG